MGKFIYVDGIEIDPSTAHKLIVGCVVPRPIAWVTTINAAGRVNAAPFSSYNYVATRPTLLAINIESRNGSPKDTANNILETGEFVINVATEATMELMHRCAEDFAPDVSEVQELGIELLQSRASIGFSDVAGVGARNLPRQGQPQTGALNAAGQRIMGAIKLPIMLMIMHQKKMLEIMVSAPAKPQANRICGRAINPVKPVIRQRIALANNCTNRISTTDASVIPVDISR